MKYHDKKRHGGVGLWLHGFFTSASVDVVVDKSSTSLQYIICNKVLINSSLFCVDIRTGHTIRIGVRYV
jgi:hypothetical protein